MNTTRSGWMVAVALLGAAALAGCSEASPVDRTGGETILLRLATSDGDVAPSGEFYGPETFVQQLEKVSSGRLRVEVTTNYGDGASDAESRIVEAIASGDLDGGWPSTRAFAGAGIAGLQAVEAPMVLTNRRAVNELITGRVGRSMLASLDGTGIAGLALAAGPLRRPFAADGPLLEPDDWKGTTFRVYNSPVQAEAVTALGGEPKDVSFAWIDQVRAGTLDGAEFDITQYAANGFGPEAPHVAANVVLWPKVFVLALSQRRFDALTEEQRGWVLEAAQHAEQASTEGAFEPPEVVADLCDEGVQFHMASESQVKKLRAALTPVHDALAENEETSSLMAQVTSLAERFPEVDVPDVPEDCDQRKAPDPPDSTMSGTAEVPDGIYRVSISVADVEDAGVSNGPGWSGIWTLDIEDGTYALSCRPLDEPGRDCGNAVVDGPLEAGFLKVEGDRVSFVFDGELLSSLNGCKLPATPEPGHCYPIPPFSATWELEGDTLTFSDTDSDAYHLTLNPWRRLP